MKNIFTMHISSRKAKKFFCFFVAIFLHSFVFADFNALGIPDSTEIRRVAADSWFYDDVNVLKYKRAELRRNALGQNFQIRCEENGNSFSVIIAPEQRVEVDLYSESGVNVQTVSQYPADGIGSWILTRNSTTMKAESIRLYFTENPNLYIQFYPVQKKVLADLVIDNVYLTRGVPLGIPFETLYTSSVQDIYFMTRRTLPWKYGEIYPGQYDEKLYMISAIRDSLPRIAFAENACYDENGEPVYISNGKTRIIDESDREKNVLTMNSAGFLKWIIDGLAKPYVGGGLYLRPLLRKTVEADPVGLKGITGQTEDLYFSLDWTRNLAAAYLSLQTGKTVLWEDSGIDVKIEPFSSELKGTDSPRTVEYLTDSGYAASVLPSFLYVLAVNEPSYCYLAAIKRPVKNTVGKPEYFTFDQCAIIFPYFDKNKRFSCVIFENGQELSLGSFVSKHEGSFVHLTRVFSSRRFFPE